MGIIQHTINNLQSTIETLKSNNAALKSYNVAQSNTIGRRKLPSRLPLYRCLKTLLTDCLLPSHT